MTTTAMINVQFADIDDPFFPMDDVSFIDGVLSSWGVVELARFHGRKRSSRYKVRMTIRDVLDFTWDPQDGDTTLTPERIVEEEHGVQIFGVIPGAFSARTSGRGRVEFAIDLQPIQERRFFRWVNLQTTGDTTHTGT